MSEETMQQLIDMISTASPIVWEAAMRRVYVVVIADLVWGVILFGCAFGLYRYIRSKDDEWDSDDPIRVMAFLFMAALALIGGIVTTSGLMWLGSPTYSAIKFLMAVP